MTNLIPAEAKRIIRIEYIMRLVTVFFLSLSVLFLILAILFASIQVLVQLRIQGLKAIATDATQYAQSIETAVMEIENANTKTKYLVQSGVEVGLLDYVNDLEEIAAGTVSIQSYALEREKENKVNVIKITAIAETRQNLIIFLDAVQEHSNFGEVEVPISDLASARNINFSVTIPIVSNDS